MLVPASRFSGRDGRTWINDCPDQAITNIRATGRDVALDINHATELKAPAGEESPACGWFATSDFENRNGAIWGRLSLNAKGRALVEGKEYRYLSPAIVFDPKTQRVLSISSVALTNQHNLDLPALNHEQTHQETDMDLTAIALALGLNADASQKDILLAIAKQKSDHATALNAAQMPDLEKFVPRADFDQKAEVALNAQNALNALKESILKAEVKGLVDDAVKAGKVAPATKDFYVGLCMQEGGAEKFKEFLAKQPVVVAPGSEDATGAPASSVALNAETKKVAGLLGVSEEDLKKYSPVAA